MNYIMIYELKNFFSFDQCSELIQKISNTEKLTPFTDSGEFINHKWVDNVFTQKLFEQLESYQIHDNILRANSILMFGLYHVGNSFALHTDTGLYYNKSTNEETRWTLLIYLNDDFLGGETIFYNDDWSVKQIIQPKKGCAILFDIDLWHQGNEIKQGSKYWIGCEIIGQIKSQFSLK